MPVIFRPPRHGVATKIWNGPSIAAGMIRWRIRLVVTVAAAAQDLKLPRLP